MFCELFLKTMDKKNIVWSWQEFPNILYQNFSALFIGELLTAILQSRVINKSLSTFWIFLHLFIVSIVSCIHMYLSQLMCVSQMTIYGSWFCPTTLRIQEIQLRFSEFCDKCPHDWGTSVAYHLYLNQRFLTVFL